MLRRFAAIFLKPRLIVTLVLLLIVAAACFAWWCNGRVARLSAPYLYNDTTAVPACKTALVLGTTNKLSNGSDNPFFTSRMDAAAALYRSGKVKYLILSGDNHIKGYDEPEMMKQALVARGVPDSALVLDYAGFRTFDSVIRCGEVFGQKSFIIVSQRFHNERAIYLARKKGLEAFALNSRDVKGNLGKTVQWREYLARVNAWLDVNLLWTKPKFLGQKIDLP